MIIMPLTCDINTFLFQVVILDVRVPCTPVARLNNHRACVNGIAWAPHSSCHICTAGKHIDGLQDTTLSHVVTENSAQ